MSDIEYTLNRTEMDTKKKKKVQVVLYKDGTLCRALTSVTGVIERLCAHFER
jgi:hypothetical protein